MVRGTDLHEFKSTCSRLSSKSGASSDFKNGQSQPKAAMDDFGGYKSVIKSYLTAHDRLENKAADIERPSYVSTGHELAVSNSEVSFDIQPQHKVKASELMRYYTPTWLVVVGLISSAIASV